MSLLWTPFEDMATRIVERLYGRPEQHEPAKEDGTFSDNPDYPQCVTNTGEGKVRCLVESIKGDRRISGELKGKRLTYLIALNARNHWAPDDYVRRSVEEARSSL